MILVGDEDVLRLKVRARFCCIYLRMIARELGWAGVY